MKGKKLLAGILSAAMVLGTMVMPAFADNTVGNASVSLAEVGTDRHGDEVIFVTFSFGETVATEPGKIVAELYSGETHMATTKNVKYLEGPGHTLKFIYTNPTHDDDPNWETELKTVWTQRTVPDTMKLYANDNYYGQLDLNLGSGYVNNYTNWADIGCAVSADDEFKEAVERNDKNILLTANVSYNRQGQRSAIADGSTIDLNGNTLTLTGYGYEFKNTTIKNGKIIISGNNGGNGIFSDYYGYTLTFDGVELTANSLKVPFLMSSNDGTGKFTLTNGTKFNVTGESTASCKFYAMLSMGSIEVLNDSKITFTGPERGILNANVKVDGTSELDFTTVKEGVYIGVDQTCEFDENAKINATTNAEAKAGGVYYDKLDKALAAATANDTVTMLADAIYNKHGNVTNANTLDLNQHKLTLDLNNDNAFFFGKMTFKNGTIDVLNTEASDAVFWAYDSSEDLVFDNITLNANNLGPCYLIESNGPSVTLKNNTVFNVCPDTLKDIDAVICVNAPNGADVIIDNSTIIHKNATGHTLLFGHIVVSGNSLISSDNVGSGIYLDGYDGGSLTVEDTAEIKVTNVIGNFDETDSEGNVIEEGWNKTKDGIILGKDTPYDKAVSATVNASVHRNADPSATASPDPNQANVTDKIALELRKVADDKYDVYAKAEDNKTIYKLTTADLNFAMSNPKLGWEIEGAENVNVVRNDNGYVRFNYKKNDETTANSGSEVKLGTITISGYGAGTLSVAGGNVNATAKTQNVTVTYDGNNLAAATANVEIKVPTQKLTIGIEFPNAVTDQSAAYQDMTVTISGGELTENKVFTLGKDSNATNTMALGEFAANVKMADGKYTMTAELQKYLTYNVEVKGAGYRTARYSVNMGGDKTLSFWNNVNTDENGINTMRAIELGTDATNPAVGRYTSFLAGDIVKDEEINIYDLSAVVSYFGVNIGGTDNKSMFAQYDLDRNGKIDSKDVSIVLNSWAY